MYDRVFSECPLLAAAKAYRLAARDMADSLEPSGLTYEQMVTLAWIELHPFGNAVQFSKECAVEKSTLSRNLRRLEKHGWLCIGPPRGRHGSGLSLTAAGKEKLRLAYQLWEQHQSAQEPVGV